MWTVAGLPACYSRKYPGSSARNKVSSRGKHDDGAHFYSNFTSGFFVLGQDLLLQMDKLVRVWEMHIQRTLIRHSVCVVINRLVFI